MNIIIILNLLICIFSLEYKKNAHIKMKPKGNIMMNEINKSDEIAPNSIIVFYSEICQNW